MLTDILPYLINPKFHFSLNQYMILKLPKAQILEIAGIIHILIMIVLIQAATKLLLIQTLRIST